MEWLQELSGQVCVEMGQGLLSGVGEVMQGFERSKLNGVGNKQNEEEMELLKGESDHGRG